MITSTMRLNRLHHFFQENPRAMPTRVAVTLGSIIEQPDCDAIVNSANANLRAGSGVCGVIYLAAGPQLEPYTMQFSPLGLGKAIVSPGFDLTPQSIIHVKGPHYLLDPNPDEYLAKAMQAVINLAEESGFQRIAVPAISTGMFKFPIEQAAAILVATALKAERLLEIRFVVIGEDAQQAFTHAGAVVG